MNDSIPRMMTTLSLFGDGNDLVNGQLVTKSGHRLPLRIGPSLFRKFTCVSGCWVCCAKLSVSLDFIPTESAWWNNPRPDLFTSRTVDVNGDEFLVWTRNKPKLQDQARRETDPNVLSRACTFLEPIRNGQPGCSLWQTGSPLGCAESYNMRVSEHPDHVQIVKTGLGRAWVYDPAPECKFDVVPVDEMDLETNIHLLERFQEWALYFKMSSAQNRLFEVEYQIREVLRTGIVPASIVAL